MHLGVCVQELQENKCSVSTEGDPSESPIVLSLPSVRSVDRPLASTTLPPSHRDCSSPYLWGEEWSRGHVPLPLILSEEFFFIPCMFLHSHEIQTTSELFLIQIICFLLCNLLSHCFNAPSLSHAIDFTAIIAALSSSDESFFTGWEEENQFQSPHQGINLSWLQ